MPRPIWTGAISFGLVTIPIRVVAATESHNINFHQVHLADMARVRTKKVCEIDGQQLFQEDIGKGYEVSKDTIVEVTDIVLHAMHWDDEIRSPETLTPKPVDLTDDEVDAAIQLLESMARDNIDDYTDHYQEAVEELLAAKAEHRQPKAVEAAPESGGQLVDLMAALNASVEKAKANRGESTEDASVHDLPKKRTAKKAAAKKTAAKKTTAKKAPAKKTAGRKPRSA
ncbi:Ku protein [Streptomyces sp. NPDC001205]